MKDTRRARIESVIQEELAMVIPREVKDPRIPAVTLTSVELSSDAGHAVIFVTRLGAQPPETEEEHAVSRQAMKRCLEGLNSAAGYLRRHLGKILKIRHIPDLVFKEDKGLDNALRVHQLLKELEKEKNERGPAHQ